MRGHFTEGSSVLRRFTEGGSMLMILFLLFMIGMAAVQGYRLYDKGKQRDLLVFGALWTVATVSGALTMAGVRFSALFRHLMSTVQRLAGG